MFVYTVDLQSLCMTGSTLVMRAITLDDAKAVRKAVSVTSRGERASQLLNVPRSSGKRLKRADNGVPWCPEVENTCESSIFWMIEEFGGLKSCLGDTSSEYLWTGHDRTMKKGPWKSLNHQGHCWHSLHLSPLMGHWKCFLGGCRCHSQGRSLQHLFCNSRQFSIRTVIAIWFLTAGLVQHATTLRLTACVVMLGRCLPHLWSVVGSSSEHWPSGLADNSGRSACLLLWLWPAAPWTPWKVWKDMRFESSLVSCENW